MPSKDWMCRSEVLLPRLRELMKDARFEVKAGTLSEVVRELGSREKDVGVRRYGMESVWHGMTLGKNGDRHPRMSRSIERDIRMGESLASMAASSCLMDGGRVIVPMRARAPDSSRTSIALSGRKRAVR